MSIGVYGNGNNSWHREKLGRNITTDEQREAMGIDWMPRKWLSQAIPPAYTEWIGRKLLSVM
jgi:DNA (cytosine-5)-methyltransferase 1